MDREVSSVVFSYYKNKPSKESEFHQNCVPKQKQQPAAPPAGTDKSKESDYAKCDAVTQDEIWKQAVNTEKHGVKEWQENWGFLADYDPKGRPKSPEELPEKVSAFSEDVPNTNAGNFGSRLNTDIGQNIQSLEFQFNSHNRKKKMGSDLICY